MGRWATTTIDTTNIEIKDNGDTRYSKRVEEAKPFCESRYSLIINLSASKRREQGVNGLQHETIKTYIYSDHYLLGHIVRSGDGSTSTLSSMEERIFNSFIAK